MKRTFSIFAIVMIVMLSVTLLAACGGNNDTQEQSALRGTFTYSETINQGLRVTNKLPGDVEVNNKQYLFSNVYPINYGNEGMAIAYGIDQRLKLNRDFTYNYDYTILISNPRDWGGTNARLVVSITGTFVYAEGANANEYSVLLSNPTGGTEQLFGATITSQDNYGWYIHSQPDLTLDYSVLSKLASYQYDQYVCSRVVSVNKTTKLLSDNVFYPEILNYIAMYSNY
ncbi:MAG: hypothetical protein J1G02_04605 [Clostridiales bacterium]|nr:hypothetical protein [Clostridiales bacterium]